MDDYSDDQPFWDAVDGKPILVLPYAIDSNDMKMWTAPSFMPADWLQYAIDSFEWLYSEGANQPRMMSLGLHLRIIGRPGRIGYFEKFLDHVLRHGGCMGRYATGDRSALGREKSVSRAVRWARADERCNTSVRRAREPDAVRGLA